MSADVSPIRVLLTAEETAERLSLSRDTIYELMRTGQLRSVKIGRARRIPVEAVAQYVNSLFTDPGDGEPIPA